LAFFIFCSKLAPIRINIGNREASVIVMTLWLVRAGKHGERENLALEKGAAIIGWEDVPDLSGISDRSALETLLAKIYPDEKPKRLSNWESQLWPIANTMQAGDLVVLPLKTRSMIAIGRITGPY
jgi:restriction system protein